MNELINSNAIKMTSIEIPLSWWEANTVMSEYQ